MDWLDLLAVQGTVENLLQHHSSKASILQHSACFTVQWKEQWPPALETEPTKLEDNKNTQGHQNLSSSRGCPLPKPPWSKPGLNWVFFFLRNHLFIYWLHWVFVAAVGFLQLQQAGTTLWPSWGPLSVVPSLVTEHRLSGRQASVAAAQGLTHSTVCGIFPDQRSNLCPLRW